MIQILLFLFLLTPTIAPTPIEDNCYDTFNSQGLHLFINDNGTPDDYCDDWIYDWEDNRVSAVVTFD